MLPARTAHVAILVGDVDDVRGSSTLVVEGMKDTSKVVIGRLCASQELLDESVM